MSYFRFFSKPVRASVSVLGAVISLFASELSFAQGSNSNSSGERVCRLTPAQVSSGRVTPIEADAFNICSGQGIEPIGQNFAGARFSFWEGVLTISTRDTSGTQNSFQVVRQLDPMSATQVAVPLTNEVGVIVRCASGSRSSCAPPAGRPYYKPGEQRAPSPIKRH
jgi:hypothetical protein